MCLEQLELGSECDSMLGKNVTSPKGTVDLSPPDYADLEARRYQQKPSEFRDSADLMVAKSCTCGDNRGARPREPWYENTRTVCHRKHCSHSVSGSGSRNCEQDTFNTGQETESYDSSKSSQSNDDELVVNEADYYGYSWCYQKFNSDEDLKVIMENLKTLVTSGFYYEDMTMLDAKAKLKNTPVGTFLVRNSADPRYLFALSLQTVRGPTSVRIEYKKGYFRLDCEPGMTKKIKVFESVVALVDYYTHRLGKKDKNAKSRTQCVWLESTGRRDTPVKLVKPIVKRTLSLQHLCRKTINGTLKGHVKEKADKLPLPKSLVVYLKQYPCGI